MLEKLMAKIAEIEKETSLPPGININASDWEPHYSSFDPIKDKSGPPELKTHRSSFTQGRNQVPHLGRPASPADSVDKALREEMTKTQGKYLPCHYFDYIGGTSTGGLVLHFQTLKHRIR